MMDKATRERILQLVLHQVDEARWSEDGKHLFIKKDGKEVEVDVQAGLEFDIPGLTEQTGHRFRVPLDPVTFLRPSAPKRDLPFNKSYLRNTKRRP